MTFRVRSLRLFGVVGLSVVAGCGSDSPSAPSTGQPVDLATVLAQLNASGLAAAGAGAMLPVPMSAGPTSVPSSCPYSAATQGFVCPTATAGGMTYGVTFWLYDAGGHALSSATAAPIASVRTVSDVKGSPTLPSSFELTGTMSVTGHSDMTMSGLLTGTPVVNGTSTAHDVFNQTSPTALNTVSDVTSTTTNLAMPAQVTNGAYWPKSGSVTIDITSAAQGGSLPAATVTIHSVVTYNGTSTATVVTTVNGVTSTCKVDLTGKGAPVCS